MSEILLGVSGGIAAYKAVELLRLLQREGHSVTVAMTGSARRFVGAATFAALSGRPVGTSLFGETDAPGYDHLDLARAADAMVVAPATANTIARMAAGLAGDLLTSAYLAVTGPVIVAPAMNTRMWRHPATEDNIALLRSRGVRIVDPGVGLLADGDVGEGRLAEPEAIAEAVTAALAAAIPTDGPWAGRRVLVTAGGTREPIDAVRYVGNRSSGRMGVALAEAARDRGAAVTLVAANLAVPVPEGVEARHVATAEELRVATREAFERCDMLIMAAAVADYRPTHPADGKLDKSAADAITITMERTTDILGEVVAARTTQAVVGFAAEHGPAGLERAREKRARKGVDAIVVNDVSLAGIGFDTTENAVTIIGPGNAEVTVPRGSKRECAERILDAVAAALGARG